MKLYTFLYPEEQRLSADVPIATREFVEMAAVLDGHMRGRQFLVGERAGVGDFVMA
jgi:glutathione S-transferase